MTLHVASNKTEDDYKRWSEQIGTPFELGVHLQVVISYSDRPTPHVLATGIVGVPRPPEDDTERQIVALKVADLIEAPDIAVFVFAGILRWRLVKGGPFAVQLIERQQIRELDPSEISHRVSLSGGDPLSDPIFRKTFAETDDWERDYRANRYLRFETRAGLNQRYQDLRTNMTVLANDGQVGLTEEKHWHELFRHVVVEMLVRGQPPAPYNLDPSVAPASLYQDPELCQRAARAVASVPTLGSYLVKYGQAEHMSALYEHGQVHMPPASDYRDPEHNQAIHDQELSLAQYSVVATDAGLMKSHVLCADAGVLETPGYRLLPLFQAPDAAGDEVVRVESHGPDAWLYCVSSLLAPRMFSDFNADACVLLDRRAFEARLSSALHPDTGKGLLAHGSVRYVDPFGAYEEAWDEPQVHIFYPASEERGPKRFQPFGPEGELARPPLVHFSKSLRFAYQSEYRFVHYPAEPTERLSGPLMLRLGSLGDIARLITL